jgi:hypothetical protein
MSHAEEAEADENNNVCANCGVAEVDDIQLEEQEHRVQNSEECKIQVKKLHDKKLFRQPDGSHRGECPICFLPMPLENDKSTFKSCCSKSICDGCYYADYKSNGGHRCPFCREQAADEKEYMKRIMKRIKANDPATMKETTMQQLNISPKQLNWETYKHIIN